VTCRDAVLRRVCRPRYLALVSLVLTSTLVMAQGHRELFMAVTPRNFDHGGEISRQFHLHAESYLRTTTIARGGQTRPLPQNLCTELALFPVKHDDRHMPFAEYVAEDALLDSVIVLHRGEIVFEAYPNMQSWQRHYAWSVSKVMAAAVLATLVADGKVDMSAAVEHYVPALADTAWAGTHVRDIANMASGIDCLDSDGYHNTSSCVYRTEEALGVTAATGAPVAFLEHVRGMGRHRPAGTLHEYASVNTHVLMLIIENVTQQPYADAVRTRIWERIGAEHDALMTISAEGYAYAAGGLSAKLRDLARFGLVFTEPERFADIARSMLADIRAGGGMALPPEASGRDAPMRAGWQWDQIWDDGAMYKAGYLGQGMYVDPGRSLVIAWFGTGLDFGERTTGMKPVARQLGLSGLFDPRSMTGD
jgi:CubicO group peptidase (beta-lactamase class C family)